MKHRLWMKVLAGSVLLLAIGISVAHFSERMDSARTGTYMFRRIAKKLHIKLPPPSPLSPAEHAEAKANAVSWKRKFLAEFPALNISERPVPADQNGFLLLYQLGNTLPISEEFSQILSDISECDLEVAKRCLAEHAEVVTKVEHIGSLQTRSSTIMPDDYMGFISARPGKQSNEILLLKARLAAEAGDENETLRCLTAAGNVAGHFIGVEAPSFLGATIYILSDLQNQRIAISTLLPALGKSADLKRWKSVLCRRPYSTAELAKLVRGEWHISADFMAFPLLAISEKQGELPDAEATMHCHSVWANDVITKLPSLGLANLESVISSPAKASKLSEEGRNMLELLNIGSSAWVKGYVRAAVVSARYQAALDLLILEKNGSTLTTLHAERATRDPVSGNPFVFDPAARTLDVPTGTLEKEEEPLKLPW